MPDTYHDIHTFFAISCDFVATESYNVDRWYRLESCHEIALSIASIFLFVSINFSKSSHSESARNCIFESSLRSFRKLSEVCSLDTISMYCFWNQSLIISVHDFSICVLSQSFFIRISAIHINDQNIFVSMSHCTCFHWKKADSLDMSDASIAFCRVITIGFCKN